MKLPKKYEQIDEWTTLMFLFDSALKEISTKIEILNNEFLHVHNYNPIEHVKSRIKSPESIVKKLKRDGHEATIDNMLKYLNDIAGIRIICSFTSDIYKIADMISKQSDVKVLIIKNYIANPKTNGYQSYHMVVSIPIFLSDGPVETKVEIQIRTIAMDFWASLEHKIYYKFEGNAPKYISEELKACADIVNKLDAKMLSLNETIQAIEAEEIEKAAREEKEARARAAAKKLEEELHHRGLAEIEKAVHESRRELGN
ncbi:MAG: GTP pyrophosphokinase family protein [Lachnospiraceae bacterium]